MFDTKERNGEENKKLVVFALLSMLNVQFLFTSTLTDEKNPLKLCRQCQRPFIAGKADAEFCSPACRDKHKKEKGKK